MRRVRADAVGISEAATVVRDGGIVAIPTDTLYGLAADPFRAAAVARVFEAKGRPDDRPLPLVAADVTQVETQLGRLTPTARALANAFWPGPLTLLVDAPPSVADAVTAGTGRVGVRVPAHKVPQALCRTCGTLLTATSANLAGQPATDDPEHVVRVLGERVDLVLDDGKTPGGAPSTIVDVTSGVPRLVRPGAIDWEEVLACVQRA
jgi:L-threonylcarbamoyladenylate synthase